MRNYFFFFLCLLFAPFISHGEYIDTFTADIELFEDASLVVTETIDYRFSEERHGIIREIPIRHHEAARSFFKERIISIDLREVTMDGASVPYELESTRDAFVIRIGDPSGTLTGAHTYEITYEVTGGLSYPPGEGTELYWNVTGNEWQVPIRVVEARITSRDGLFRTVRSCYRGTFGYTSGSCLVREENGSVIFRTTELDAGEGMTIAQSLNPVRTAVDKKERMSLLGFIVPVFLITLLLSGWGIYRYKTRNKTGRTIIPQYEPYPDTKPMYAGLLMDGRFDPRDVTAGIVYLAEQGYLKIRKTERKAFFLFEVDDYEIVLVKEPDEKLGHFERKVIELLFDAPFVLGKTLALSTLKTDEKERQSNYKAFQNLQEELRTDLKEAGFYEHLTVRHMLMLVGGIVGMGFLIMVLVFKTMNGVVLVGLGIAAVLIGVMLHRRRTYKGYEALDHLRGFKLFLEMTDRDRFAFHNAPQKSPEQFMEYLPYAIAFGVEKQWAKTFDDITIPLPSWYEGGSMQSFTPVNLSTSLGAFSSAFAASGGTGASSGGGSSGGGAGGGGGGSW